MTDLEKMIGNEVKELVVMGDKLNFVNRIVLIAGYQQRVVSGLTAIAAGQTLFSVEKQRCILLTADEPLNLNKGVDCVIIDQRLLNDTHLIVPLVGHNPKELRADSDGTDVHLIMQRINVQLQENLVAIIVKILYVRVFAGMVEQLTAGRSFFQKATTNKQIDQLRQVRKIDPSVDMVGIVADFGIHVDTSIKRVNLRPYLCLLFAQTDDTRPESKNRTDVCS